MSQSGQRVDAIFREELRARLRSHFALEARALFAGLACARGFTFALDVLERLENSGLVAAAAFVGPDGPQVLRLFALVGLLDFLGDFGRFVEDHRSSSAGVHRDGAESAKGSDVSSDN